MRAGGTPARTREAHLDELCKVARAELVEVLGLRAQDLAREGLEQRGEVLRHREGALVALRHDSPYASDAARRSARLGAGPTPRRSPRARPLAAVRGQQRDCLRAEKPRAARRARGAARWSRRLQQLAALPRSTVRPKRTRPDSGRLGSPAHVSGLAPRTEGIGRRSRHQIHCTRASRDPSNGPRLSQGVEDQAADERRRFSCARAGRRPQPHSGRVAERCALPGCALQGICPGKGCVWGVTAQNLVRSSGVARWLSLWRGGRT